MCGKVKSSKTKLAKGASSHEQVCHKQRRVSSIRLDHVACGPMCRLGPHGGGSDFGVGRPDAGGGLP